MPWKVSTPVDKRFNFIQTVLHAPHGSLSSICQQFTISRTTGYKWLSRYQAGGLAALFDQDRTPHQQPTRTLDQIEDRICQLRRENPVWGARKIRHRLMLDDPEFFWPTWRTVHRVLLRHRLIESPVDDSQQSFKRFERASPNELWQMDIKGWFHISGQGRCHPITILDDHSRFCLGIGAAQRETQNTVWQVLEQAFLRYGLPLAILTDNGPTFVGTSSEIGLSVFKIRLFKLGVTHYTGRPRHPQTQGKIERFHRTLKEELLKRIPFRDHQDAQQQFENWIVRYNNYRPHEALSGQVPSSRYRHSCKSYQGMPDIIYPSDSLLRRVNAKGLISYCNRKHFISKALRGEMVQLRQSSSRARKIYFKDLYICSIKS